MRTISSLADYSNLGLSLIIGRGVRYVGDLPDCWNYFGFVTPNMFDDKENWIAPEQIYGGMTNKNMERDGTMWNINLVRRTIEKRTTALTIN